ncbi:MAG: pyridoxal-dependent decarboxylase [Candidatus Eremiobacteraeota bacterium]|nr:pyridoxal-dependent decarboxylase [Candidatus Eremiobacteraeota bacterium]
MDILQDEFSRVGRFIDDYLEHPERYPVLARTKPGEIAAALPGSAPETGESFDALMDDFERVILPGITHWNHPRFFAYFATSAAPVAIAAEALAATLDVKAMLWRTSPAASELEAVVMRWLGRLLGVPDAFTGIIYDTASIAGFTALAAAREALDLDIRRKGMTGRDLPQLRVYITAHTHSHVEKAAIALGIGQENVVKIACDGSFRMLPAALDAAIAADLAAGHRPMAIVATVGTTSTTSIDPVPEIAAIARARGVWLHVDAAYAGAAAIVPEFRHILDGADLADSLVFNPHKWLFVPMDCSTLFIRDEALLRRAFSLVPAYLETTDGDVRNYMDYGLQLGRRFRALKLWFVLRYYGAEGLRTHLRSHVALAAEFAGWVAAEPDWRVVAPHPFSVVCFRFEPVGASAEATDAANREILARVNADGAAFLSHTEIDGRYVLRLAIGNLRTTRDDVAAVWVALRAAC